MVKSKLTLVVLRGGLFQLYSDPNEKYLSYEDILERLNEKSNNRLKPIIEKYVAQDSSNIKQTIDQAILQDLNLTSITNLFTIENIQTIPLEHFQEMKAKHNVIFVYKNLLQLYIDLTFLTLIKAEKDIEFVLENETNFNNNIKNDPQNFLVFGADLEELYSYHLKGTWTAYLALFVKMALGEKEKEYFGDFNRRNLDVLRAKKKFFEFSVFFFVQLKNYLPIIEKLNSQVKEGKDKNSLIQKELADLGIKTCLSIYRYFFKSGEIKRAHLFICNDKVNYVSYIGSTGQEGYDDLLDLSIHGHIDAIIAKMSDSQEITLYQKLRDAITGYIKNKPIFCCTKLENVLLYLDRGKMVEQMNKFIKEAKDPKILCPTSYLVQLKDVYEYEEFTKFLKEKKITFPLMLKYSGPKTKYNHLMISIVNDYGLRNYIPFIKSYTEGDKEKVSQIIQTFVNHGGYVIKGYFINKKSYFYYRPSFPDVSEDLIQNHEEYRRGFYQTTTSDLVKDEFKNFWSKLTKNNKIKELVDERYMSSIMEKFEKFSGDSLFGIDFLFDSNNNLYYIIDINQFPGYKELVPEFNEIITEHITKYLKK